VRRREHLVCVTTSAQVGGAETSLLTLLQALKRFVPDWQMTVVAPSAGALLDRCREIDVETRILEYPVGLSTFGEPGRWSSGPVALRLARAALAARPYIRQLHTLLTSLQPSIVHSNGIKAHVATALAVPTGARLVWHVHEYVGSRRVTARLLRRLAEKPHAVVVNSDSVRQDVVAALGRSQGVTRIHNAIDLSVFNPVGAALDLAAACGLSPDAGLVRIGLVATFGRWKGHEVFLDALSEIAAELPIRGYILGGPVYQTSDSQRTFDELRQYAVARGLENKLGFTGHIADVAAALRGLDIVVHASTCPEPFGMVIAEGMASGRAVVAVQDGGARELFDNEVDAFGHTMGDARDLARQLRRLATDPALRAALGEAARRSAVSRFAPERMASEFLQVYAA
jgi:glycosyltransferase involved in cell wall biosynthesis